jgi:hypothetical protein
MPGEAGQPAGNRLVAETGQSGAVVAVWPSWSAGTLSTGVLAGCSVRGTTGHRDASTRVRGSEIHRKFSSLLWLPLATIRNTHTLAG